MYVSHQAHISIDTSINRTKFLPQTLPPHQLLRKGQSTSSEQLFYLPDQLISSLTFQPPSPSDQLFSFSTSEISFTLKSDLLFHFLTFGLFQFSASLLFCVSAFLLFLFLSFSAFRLLCFSAFPLLAFFAFPPFFFSAFQLLSHQTALALGLSAISATKIYLLVLCLHYLKN